MRGGLIYAALALPALLTGAGAVVGQELPFSMRATDACLADKGRGDVAASCIGVSAELCISKTTGSYAMAGCYAYELEQWDSRLNSVYGKLMVQEKAIGRAQALRNKERAWIKSRDTRCDYHDFYEQWGGGTGTNGAYTQCLMQMTGKQTLVLRDQLQGD